MRPVRRTGDGFPPHKFYHGHPLPPNNSSNGQCNTPINFLGILSRRKVLSFTINCNSGPCYVFVVLNRHRRETCTQSRALLHLPTIQKIHFSSSCPVSNYCPYPKPCDSSTSITITYFSRVTVHHSTSTVSPIA